MKKDTVVRLHLTKQLLESLTKQIIAEAKKSGDMSGGAYTEAVKEPKGAKKGEKSEALNLSKNEKPNVMPTGGEKTQGMSKQQVGQALVNQGTTLKKDTKGNIQSGEGGVIVDLMNKIIKIAKEEGSSSATLMRAAKVLDAGVEKAKGEMNEEEEHMGEASITDPAVVAPALAFLGSGAAIVISLLKDLKNAKTPEERKQVLQNLASAIEGSKGTKGGDLKEYEQYYRLVNGQCRRYNDEGEYTVVSMHYCR